MRFSLSKPDIAAFAALVVALPLATAGAAPPAGRPVTLGRRAEAAKQFDNLSAQFVWQRLVR